MPILFQTIIILASGITWGSQHPVHRSYKRATWSQDEYKFMKNFHDTNGGMVTAQDCYRAILQDVDAYPLFHHNHMADRTRICHPWDNVKNGNIPEFLAKSSTTVLTVFPSVNSTGVSSCGGDKNDEELLVYEL